MINYIWGDIAEINNESGVKDIHVYRTHNEVWFNHSVNDESINKLIKLMYEVVSDEKLSAYRETVQKTEIILHIDSCGGSVKSVFKFIDFANLLRKKNVKIRTIINGFAASAATLMAIIGDEREITPHSYAMIHELSTVIHGRYTEIKSYTKCIDFLHAKILNIYKKHRNANADVKSINLEELLNKETWMDAEEYLKYGFVDRICE